MYDTETLCMFASLIIVLGTEPLDLLSLFRYFSNTSMLCTFSVALEMKEHAMKGREGAQALEKTKKRK